MHCNVVTAGALYFQRLGVTTLRLDFAGSQIGRGRREVTQVVEAADFLLGGRHLEAVSVSGDVGAGCGPGPGLSRRRAEDGTSSGTPAGGIGEQSTQNEDPTTAAQHQALGVRRGRSPSDPSRGRKPPDSILLFGYSYGALIAASASANIHPCVGIVSVAPPIGVEHWLLLFNSRYHARQSKKRKSLPRLLVMGTRDDFTSETAFAETLRSYPPESTTGALLKGADHFFVGRETDLMNVVGRWMLSVYPLLDGDLRRLGWISFLPAVSGAGARFGARAVTSSEIVELSEEEKGSGSYAFMGDLCDCAVLRAPCVS